MATNDKFFFYPHILFVRSFSRVRGGDSYKDNRFEVLGTLPRPIN